MIKKLFLTACSVVMLAVMASCGKLDPLTADNFVCNPNPLVEQGGMVNATITVTYPEKYFNKKATLTITPVMEYAAGETKGTPVSFQGEKVSGNDQEINYKYGGTATFRCGFLYLCLLLGTDAGEGEGVVAELCRISNSVFQFSRCCLYPQIMQF